MRDTCLRRSRVKYNTQTVVIVLYSIYRNNKSVGSEASFILRFSSLGKYDDDVNCN